MDTERLGKLETKIETILPTLATKADVAETKTAVAEAKAAITMWLAVATVATIAVLVSVMAFMFNRAFPQQPAAQMAPIIIYPQPTNPPASQSPPATKRGQ